MQSLLLKRYFMNIHHCFLILSLLATSAPIFCSEVYQDCVAKKYKDCIEKAWSMFSKNSKQEEIRFRTWIRTYAMKKYNLDKDSPWIGSVEFHVMNKHHEYYDRICPLGSEGRKEHEKYDATQKRLRDIYRDESAQCNRYDVTQKIFRD